MSYGMQRDSRRDHGQWRGCHTFQNIRLGDDDSNAAAGRTTRSGGLKMGKTYYYYYELDGCTETHDPTMPSTSTCPYLPGQRVNMLWMPARGAAAAAATPSSPASRRQRSASTSSLRPYEYQTMNPADRFVTPRQAPATPAPTITVACRDHSPSTTPAKLQKKLVARSTKTRNVLIRTSLSAAAVGMATNTNAMATPPPPPATAAFHTVENMQQQPPQRTRSPLPSAKLLLQRHQQPSPSPPPTFSTWSPRRLFVRRPSPARSVSSSVTEERSSRSTNATDESPASWPPYPAQQQLAPPSSSSSTMSRSSSSSRPPLALQMQGSRSRDISPESLRRFLVDDVPFLERSSSRRTSCCASRGASRCASRCSSRADGRVEEAVAEAVSAPSTLSTTSREEQSIEEDDDEYDLCNCTASQPPASPKPPVLDNLDDDFDAADDDELNFALSSATSESAPMTVLSPPPPPPQLPQLSLLVASQPALSLDAAVAGSSSDGSMAERTDHNLCLSAVAADAHLQLTAAAKDSDIWARSPVSGVRGLVDELGWLATAIQRLD